MTDTTRGVESEAVRPRGRATTRHGINGAANGHAEHHETAAPPHSIEAEEHVLGGIMLDSTRWPEVQILPAADFYRPDHRLIWSAIGTLCRAGSPADPVTVGDTLKRLGQLEAAGGFAYLGTLLRDTASAFNVAAYAKIIRERAQLRRLLALDPDIRSAIAEGATADQIVAALRSTFESIDVSSDAYPLIAVDELLEAHAPPVWIVEQLLEKDATVGLVGPPESSKSLLAANIAACVATGAKFHDRPCTGGLVVYLWGEGQPGAARRLQAIEQRYRLGLRGAPLLLSKVAASLLDPNELACVKRSIDSAVARYGRPLALLIVDTLARFIAPGDESAAEDMGAFLNAVQTLRGEATAVICHHPGHGDNTRGRGSSSWRAGLDAEFTLAREGELVTVTCQKMKDAEKPAPFSFSIEVTATSMARADGSPVQSVVLVPTQTQTVIPGRAALSGKNQKRLLAELERLAALPGEVGIWTLGELREIGRRLDMHKNSARDAVIGLQQLGYLIATLGGSRLADGITSGTKDRNRTESTISARDSGPKKGTETIPPLGGGSALSSVPTGPEVRTEPILATKAQPHMSEAMGVNVTPQRASAIEPQSVLGDFAAGPPRDEPRDLVDCPSPDASTGAIDSAAELPADMVTWLREVRPFSSVDRVVASAPRHFPGVALRAEQVLAIWQADAGNAATRRAPVDGEVR